MSPQLQEKALAFASDLCTSPHTEVSRKTGTLVCVQNSKVKLHIQCFIIASALESKIHQSPIFMVFVSLFLNSASPGDPLGGRKNLEGCPDSHSTLTHVLVCFGAA